jgi:Ca2+/Na+ antiporter
MKAVDCIGPIWVLALVDWALTVDALALGVAKEANPAMRWIMGQAPEVSFLIKMGLTTILLVFLYHIRDNKMSDYLAAAALTVYIIAVVFQCLARLWVIGG